jgi:hypothetical protein
MLGALAAPVAAKFKSLGQSVEPIQLNLTPRVRPRPTTMRTLPPLNEVTEHTMVYRDDDIAHTRGITTGMPVVPLLGEKIKTTLRNEEPR